jgi:hypothetical protein
MIRARQAHWRVRYPVALGELDAVLNLVRWFLYAVTLSLGYGGGGE